MKTKSSFIKGLSERSLVALLIFSFICTLLGFGTAYNEHKNLAELSRKYDEAIEKINECQLAVSSLSDIAVSLQSATIPATYENISHSQADASAESSAGAVSDNISQTQPVSGQYYVTENGSKYHISSCSYLSKSCIPVSLETIKSKGYTPCSRCIN